MQVNNNIDILIAKHFSEELTIDEENMLTSWLNEDVNNIAYFNQLRNIWQVSYPSFNPETIDVAKAEKKIMKTIKVKRWTQMPAVVWWQRIAAIIILPLFLLMAYLINKEKNLTAEVVYQEIFSPFGVRSQVNLPDGSKVWLNSGSRLKYPVVFKSGIRDVYLSGEAYFEVHSDKNNPFMVKTANLAVKATGTAFNVEAYSTDSVIAVTLVHGKVNVELNNDRNIALVPNQRLSYNNKSNSYNLAKVDTYKWCTWRNGILVFRNDPLDYVFKKIGQMYNVDILVKDTQIASQPYRATFEGESLEEILRLMKMTAPIRYRRTERFKTKNGEFSKEKIEVYKQKINEL
ncbi:FecR family protein [Bacteroides sedimenti]|uniref:Iron dicitrate transporter FecR n=1 Tax=Bacteroides sedimenti TaxID=2136147 RepID=A0ABM8IDK5_9BACE